jgi:uncharacterized repeat protein (TIGR01451 family)
MLALAGFLATTAWSGDEGPLKLDLKVFKVLRAEGKESLAPVEKVKPRDIVEYQVKYQNTSDKTLSNIAATLPIPAGLEYLPGTAEPGAAVASLDGKNFAAIPLKRKVKQANGSEKTVAVPYAEYRALRWTLPQLAAKKSVVVSARARVR